MPLQFSVALRGQKDVAVAVFRAHAQALIDKAALGNYRTKRMVPAFNNALAAGGTGTDVAV